MILQFDAFALDPQRHVLTRDGEDVALSAHLVDILGHLVRQRGSIVSKDALLEMFWPDVHVTENTLTRAIADIRRALGDSAASPMFIQTVARRGYRFIAPSAERTDDHGHPDPYRDVVRGGQALETLQAGRLVEAVQAFERAVAHAPDYAPAHAGLASACFLQFEATRADNAPSRDPLMRALTHARRAAELDPSLGEAWAALGFALAAVGQVEEARAVLRRAAALEPTSWRHQFRLALASWGEERLRACDRSLALLPEFAPARFAAAMVFIARQAFVPALAAVTAGAAAQSRGVAHEGAPFPSIGLHWLRGLLLLHERQIALAVQSFAREIDELPDDQIYAREFRANAQIGAGFAHLSAGDPGVAAEVFRLVLESFPHNGRALIGMSLAFQQTSFGTNTETLLSRLDLVVAELRTGERLAEAAIVAAAADAIRGDLARACATLEQFLEDAPPGQAGWLIPIDPMLAPLRAAPQYQRIAALLAARAS